MRKILVVLLIGMTQFLNGQSYQFTIAGSFSEIKSKSGALKLWDIDHRKNVFVDSIRIDAGGNLDYTAHQEPGLYVLSIDDVGEVYLAVDNMQRVRISYSQKKLMASGATDVELLNAYEVFRKESLSKWMDDVRREIREAKKSERTEFIDSLALIENRNYAAHRKELTNWVENNMGTSVAVYATSLRWSYSDVNFMKRLLPEFKKEHPDLKITKLLEEKVARFSRVAIGQQYVDFVSQSPNGQEVSLSSIKGKYVLLDFWASWCGPCRRENPHLVKQYNRYHKDGFEIIGVSLDKRSFRWVSAIEKDQLSWTQVSDLKGYSGAAPMLYNVSAIPSNVLMDSEGKIVAYNLFGKDLEMKLQELMK
ncbi:TlpA family protein disulfide reductase [bacterium SCSIO 12643]|nr:TlpA family protein disulfide reductase [bacterium SCSIO 12643]